MYWHQSLLLRGFDEHDSTVLLPFSFGYDRVLHVANVFPPHRARVNVSRNMSSYKIQYIKSILL